MQLPSDDHRGQVLVIVAMMLVILLVFAGLTIDVGRQATERRHVQNAADAAALAGCRSLIDGESDAAALADARTTALVNLQGSPVAGTATIAPDGAPVYDDGHAGDPAYLRSGILIGTTSIRVAISSRLDATLGRVVGVSEFDTGARARCGFGGGPAVPLVARRYTNPPGPGGGFIDVAATDTFTHTSTIGAVDPNNTLDTSSGTVGYSGTGRTPASESDPGPIFQLYGPNSKATNDSSFRGFVALDVRNFQSTTSRAYYNGATAQSSDTTLKAQEGAYLITGYHGGPSFPSVTQPPDPNDQVAVLSGNDTPMVITNFSESYHVGSRLLLAVYNGTEMQIPDFAISPPASFALPSTTTTPVTGPTFTVSRNDAFNSTVSLTLHGDHAASNPAWDLIPAEPPSVSPPTSGHMNMPTWSTDNFIPTKQGTQVSTSNIQTNNVPVGIYTVWLEGQSGNPYFQSRLYAVPVQIGAATRDFSLANSTTSGSAANIGNVLNLPIYVSTGSGTSGWGSTTHAVSLSIDPGSFTDCSFNPASIGPGQISLSTNSVVPSTNGSGALSTLTINTSGLPVGCYEFNLRAAGTNGDNQPVVHLQQIKFTVATSASAGSYVDVIGFAVFQVTSIDANGINVQAISAVYANPNDRGLLRGEHARLLPW